MSPLQSPHSILKSFAELLKDLTFVLKQEKLPVIKLEAEQTPDNIQLEWQPLAWIETSQTNSPAVKPTFFIERERLAANITCKLCPERISAIRSFIRQGRKPIIVVHYTGETRPTAKSFVKKSPSLIFRTVEADDLFRRMLGKTMNLELDDLYYQEFPGCIFHHGTSTAEDWQRRVMNCKNHLENSIQLYDIQGIIFTGNAAPLYFGEKAVELTDTLHSIEISGKQYPCIVIRSPEALLSYENKRKKLQNGTDQEALALAKEEEISVKNSVINQLNLFKEKLRLV